YDPYKGLDGAQKHLVERASRKRYEGCSRKLDHYVESHVGVMRSLPRTGIMDYGYGPREEPATLEAAVARAEAIVVVTSKKVDFEGFRDDTRYGGRYPSGQALVTFKVERVLKGSPPVSHGQVQVEMIGGVSGSVYRPSFGLLYQEEEPLQFPGDRS